MLEANLRSTSHVRTRCHSATNPVGWCHTAREFHTHSSTLRSNRSSAQIGHPLKSAIRSYRPSAQISLSRTSVFRANRPSAHIGRRANGFSADLYPNQKNLPFSGIAAHKSSAASLACSISWSQCSSLNSIAYNQNGLGGLHDILCGVGGARWLGYGIVGLEGFPKLEETKEKR